MTAARPASRRVTAARRHLDDATRLTAGIAGSLEATEIAGAAPNPLLDPAAAVFARHDGKDFTRIPAAWRMHYREVAAAVIAAARDTGPG